MLSVIFPVSSSSGGVGVVDSDNRGVDGGAFGVSKGLPVNDEISEKSGVDVMKKDEDSEDGSGDSTIFWDGRNLPRWSRFMGFASVATVGSSF